MCVRKEAGLEPETSDSTESEGKRRSHPQFKSSLLGSFWEQSAFLGLLLPSPYFFYLGQ